MSSEKIRCHPTVIVEKTLGAFPSVVVVLILLVAWIDSSAILSMLVLALVALLLFYYRQWKRTTIQFNDTDVVIERDTLFQMKKTLPYAKMASVNVNRDIPNRLFGTSKLLININSGTSAMVPEAVLTFERDVAERLRSEMSQRLYDHDISPDEEETIESLATFTPLDVIMHGLLSVSTYQTLLGSVFLAYSLFELYISTVAGVQAGGGAMFSLLMFVAVQVAPSVSLILRYYNYKVYRRGDTVYLQHGLIRTYKTSFDVSRINAVRVKSTLAARLLGRSCIEAEVVGLVSEGGERSRPVLCLLKDDATQQRVLRELVPEFVYERRPNKQPEGAKRVLLIRAAVTSLVVALAMVVPSVYVYREVAALTGVIGTPGVVLQYVLPLVTALAILAILYAAHVAYRVTEFDAGEDLFTFVNGAVDRETVVMNYDKVQMVWITQGPVARIFGVSRGSVYMLSSTGSSSISSGYFPGSQLERINEIVMDRITSGRYDYRKTASDRSSPVVDEGAPKRL
ncbi:MAG: PH domain-containing protein [Methanoculleus bourgensis]|uniref:PH domain-containing protein n=1 Tax=Methanoculleus bourgensis TaxID=83986 RepID=A0A8T7H3W1_9EURY|nr:PH domain-containing protein [Methanoculleus bourgensis]